MSFVAKATCLIACIVALGGDARAASDGGRAQDLSAQRRTSITVYPRRVTPGPNATRHCNAWLAREYRASGTVIVPRMVCVWR
jgi:hypothetical protein